MLLLKVDDCKPDGIHVATSKTNKAVIYVWSPELKEAVEQVKARALCISCPFCSVISAGQGM